jgi:hypothetical protein
MNKTVQTESGQNSNNEKRSKDKTTKESSPKTQESNQSEIKTQPGQIFEESTQSISSMTKDMQEAANLVSMMKKELEEKKSRIAELIASGNPLDDPFGVRSTPEASFIAEPKETTIRSQNKIQTDQRFYTNQLYELISTKLDMIIEQNKQVIKILNSNVNHHTVFP